MDVILYKYWFISDIYIKNENFIKILKYAPVHGDN